MSEQSTVLYDAPGPRARARNRVTTVVFVAILVAAVGYIVYTLTQNDQFTAEKWSPFTEVGTWTTWILPGLWGTLKAAFVSIILALLIGALLGIGRLSDHRPVRFLSGLIVELFRAVPVLILMFFAYFLFAKYAVVPSSQLAFAAVVFGLTLYNGSVIAEILRAGILAVPKGQSEAAQSIGLRKSQMMRIVLLPQAVTAMLPALISQMVIALKDSALGYAIGYVEVVRSGIVSASYWGNYLPSLVVVAIIMILINYGLTALASYLEQRFRGARRKAPGAAVPAADLG